MIPINDDRIWVLDKPLLLVLPDFQETAAKMDLGSAIQKVTLSANLNHFRSFSLSESQLKAFQINTFLIFSTRSGSTAVPGGFHPRNSLSRNRISQRMQLPKTFSIFAMAVYAAGVLCCILGIAAAQIPVNGGFESDLTGWTQNASFYSNSNSSRANSGSKYAYFGVGSDKITAAHNASGYISQTVTIPSGSNMSLDFWLWIASDEGTSTAFDKLFVDIHNSSGTFLGNLATFSNKDKSGSFSSTVRDYRLHSLELDDYDGQTVQIRFRGTTDAATATLFRLDDVTLSGRIRLTVEEHGGGNLDKDDINAVLLFKNTGGDSIARKQPPSGNPMNFDGVPFGSYYFFVFCWDMLAAESGTFTHDSNSESVSAVANQKRSLNLYAFCNDNNTPLANATVTLWSWNGETSQWNQRADGTTNASGIWSVAAWPTTLSGEKYRATVNYGGNQVGMDSNITVPNSSSGRTMGIYTSVVPPPPAVSKIVSITPSSLPDDLLMGGNWQQTVDVYGTGFVYGGQFAVRLGWTGDLKILDQSQITAVDNTHFKMNINVGSDVDIWSIQVRNYDGQWSIAHYFEVELSPIGFQLQTPLVNQVSSNWQAQLNWGESLYTDSYEVYRDNQIIAPNLPASTRQYTDTGSLTPGAAYSYRINAKNRVGSTFSNTQSVNIPDGNALNVQVISPNGGESFAPGGTQMIQWGVTGSTANQNAINYFWIAVSTNGGASFTNLSTADRMARSLSWTVPPGLNSSAMRVRVRALDSTGNILNFDVSDSNFTVSPADSSKPQVVIQAPDGLQASPGKILRFNSNGSSASSGATITGYNWRVQGAGVTAQSSSISLAFIQSGTVWVELEVTDSSGKSAKASVTVFVQGLGLEVSGTHGNFSLDPVNIANGNFIMDNVDLSLPGRGLPFRFRRFYNSHAYIAPGSGESPVAPGPLGFSWRHSFEINISAIDERNQRAVRWDDGRVDLHTLINGSYSPPSGVYDTLVENGDQTVTLITKSQIRYLFDTTGMLTAIKDRNDNTITVAHDAAQRVDFVTDTVGRVIDFQYNSDGRLAALEHDLEQDNTTTPPTIVKRRMEYEYDANQDLRLIRDARGKHNSLVYDSLHQIIEGYSAKGHRFVKNEYGTGDYSRAVVKQWDALNHLSRFEYNFTTHVTRFFDALCETDAARQPEIHEHDDRLRLIKRTDPGGFVDEFGYDANGSRTSVKDKRGSVTTYQYDGRGNVTRQIAPLEGGVKVLNDTVITYNTFNDPIERTDPGGAISRWEYDLKGNVSAVTFPYIAATPERYKRKFTVNQYGQVTDKVNARDFTTHIDYDAKGSPWKVTDALGGETKSYFDLAGRVIKTIDALDRPTEYLLDAADHVVRVRRIFGGQSVDTTSTYDDNCNLESVTDALSRTITYYHDEKDRQFKVRVIVDGENRDTMTEFDALDRKIRTTDPRGVWTSFAYDAGGRAFRITHSGGNSTFFTYNENGKVKEYNEEPSNRWYGFSYDVLDREIQRIDPNGNSVRTEFNLAGQVWKTFDALDRPTVRAYDLAGNLATLTDPNPTQGALPVEFGYDDENNRISMKDPRGKQTAYAYDELNRRISETQPTTPSTTTHWSYDAVGNLDQVTDGMAQIIGREYDELNRLKRVIYPTGPPVEFGYDLAGNRLSMTDSVGTTIWTYDGLNRAKTQADPHGLTLGFGYDRSGNRNRVTYPGNRVASYEFDLGNRLTKTTDWQNREIVHSYDTTGRLDTIILPNGTTTKFGYDAASRLTRLTHRRGTDAPFADYFYTLGKSGTVDETTGTEPLPPTFTASATTYTYDNANQLATLNGNAVTHDPNGNLTAAHLSPQSTSNDTLIFDYENRLTSATFSGQTTTSTYNGLGHRLMMTRGGQTTRFLVDGTAPLAQIMAEADASGNVTALYLHAGGLAARILPDGTSSYYHADRRGSTVALTDGAGDVTDRYAYDDFGVPAGSTGSSQNPFRYLGRFGVHDSGDGTLFVRARHYHPDLGRFLSRDPLTGRDSQPQTLNRYIYALNNPLTLVDVSGYSAQESSQTRGLSLDRRAFLLQQIAAGQAQAAYLSAYSEGIGDTIDNYWKALAGVPLALGSAPIVVAGGFAIMAGSLTDSLGFAPVIGTGLRATGDVVGIVSTGGISRVAGSLGLGATLTENASSDLGSAFHTSFSIASGILGIGGAALDLRNTANAITDLKLSDDWFRTLRSPNSLYDGIMKTSSQELLNQIPLSGIESIFDVRGIFNP